MQFSPLFLLLLDFCLIVCRTGINHRDKPTMVQDELSKSYAEPVMLKPEIKTLEEFLSLTNLQIPQYQRPYKWQDYHVLQLVDDLLTQNHKPSYRLGTVVLHENTVSKNNNKLKQLELVDGQQRTITILLILKAYFQTYGISQVILKDNNRKADLETILNLTKTFKFSSLISKANIQKNYQTILQEVNKPEFTLKTIEFLLNSCELVVITLTNLSEAFQFFDAQNARGRDLSPHDLLKAYHLREFSSTEEDLKASTVKHWEDTDSRELANLFALYLYRIKGWTNGKSARHFTKADIDLFKGVNTDAIDNYPFLRALKITHLSIDGYNNHHVNIADNHQSDYPFQLDQILINGRRFFEFVNYYQRFQFLFNTTTLIAKFDLSESTIATLTAMDEYEGRYRTGDKYVRSIFNCLLMYYYDKFGVAQLSQAIDKIFVWAYYLRLSYKRLALASVDNYVLEVNLFESIRSAMKPKDFLHIPLRSLEKVESKKTNKIDARFIDLGYMNAK